MSSLKHRREMPRRRAGGMMLGWKIFFQGAAVGLLVLPVVISGIRCMTIGTRESWIVLTIEVVLMVVAFWYGGKNAEKVF